MNLCRARFRRARLETNWLRRQSRSEPEARPAYDPGDREEVLQALGRLPYRQRAAVVLRYYEDLTVEQTAQVLRCSTRAANSLLARALSALRADLAKEDP